MHYHYASGLQFLLDQSQQSKDWQSYVRMLPMVVQEVLERMVVGMKSTDFVAKKSILTPSKQKQQNNYPKNNSSILDCNSKKKSVSLIVGDKISSNLVSSTTENIEQMWQLWRWKPPVQSALQSRDYDYFHNPTSTPHSIMHEFKKHLSASKDLKFGTNDLRRLAEIEYQPLMSFVTQDDYDDHTDSIVRSYFIFKEGVMPLWEDEYNVFGGCWSLIINRDSTESNDDCDGLKIKTSKQIWKQVINVLTDLKIQKYVDEICGVGLTIRSNKTYKITVWNRNSDNTITKMMIGQNIKSILSHSGPMFYYSHKSTLKNQYERKKMNRVRRRIFMNNNNSNNLANQHQNRKTVVFSN